MEIAIEQHGKEHALVRLRGELRREAGQQIEERVHPLFAAKSPPVLVDLGGLTAIDSTGLTHIISLATHARMCGSRVVFFAPTPFVAGVFEVTRLDTWLDIADDLPAAQKRLTTAR